MYYRRAFIPGGTYFFTVVTARRRKLFGDEASIDVLRQAFCHVNSTRPFTIDALVILPDHLHCIWTLPPSDSDYPTRWRLLKTWVTKHRPGPAPEAKSLGRSDYAALIRPTGPARPAVWQGRYWEHVIRDETDYRQHVDYIHYNPVKHGYVQRPWDWAYSSFRHYVQQGRYPQDWGETAPVFGEGVGHE